VEQAIKGLAAKAQKITSKEVVFYGEGKGWRRGGDREIDQSVGRVTYFFYSGIFT